MDTLLIRTLSMGSSVSILINWVRLYVGFEDTHSHKIGQNVQILRYMADIILGRVVQSWVKITQG